MSVGKELEIPDGPEVITADWLSAALGCSVNTFDVTHIGGWRADVYRVNLSDRSVIAKLSSRRPNMRDRSIDLYVREVRFYRELAEHTSLRVPTCFYADIDEKEGLHVLLLEDVGAVRRDCTPEQAEQAVLAIAQFHAEWWGKPPGWASGEPFDPAEFQARHEAAWPEFLRRAGHQLPTELRPTAERLGRYGDDIHRRVFAPQTLIHRDFGPTNMSFDPLYVFDWQAVRSGAGPWDSQLPGHESRTSTAIYDRERTDGAIRRRNAELLTCQMP